MELLPSSPGLIQTQDQAVDTEKRSEINLYIVIENIDSFVFYCILEI